MKLGTQTVNVHSALMCNSKQIVPVEGMGATVCMWSDRHAGTVLWIDQAKSIVCIRRDKATAENQMHNRGWAYEADPRGEEYRFKLKDGIWRQLEYVYWTGKPRWVLTKKGSGMGLTLGKRDEYYDNTF